jgi:hypothetical protein
MTILGLREQDQQNLILILEDMGRSVSCEVGIAGSLAQRAVSSQIRGSLEGEPLHDIDLMLLGAGPSAPELPGLREFFRVLEVVHSENSLYYGMIHKASGMWVDLFTPPYKQEFASVEISGRRYRVSRLESQMLYLAHDILHRAKTGYPIRTKWLVKLRTLCALPEIDWTAVESESKLHPEYLSSVLPGSEQVRLSAKDFIATALSKKPTSKFRDKLFLVWWYFFLRKNTS